MFSTQFNYLTVSLHGDSTLSMRISNKQKNKYYQIQIKISDNSRAENIFEKVLICLRMSKLDYIVKETPYSAYLTIRKKFAKSAKVGTEDIERVGQDDNIAKLDKVQKENNFLKQKIEEVEKGCANLKVKN